MCVRRRGGDAVKARWCNDRNFDLLADGDDSGGDQTLVGGWGLTSDGECCLTTWLSPFFVPDAIPQAVGLVGNVLSYHAGAVLTAVAADPGAVTGHPMSPRRNWRADCRRCWRRSPRRWSTRLTSGGRLRRVRMERW